MVLVSKKERYAIFKYLLLEGLIVVKKDNNLGSHTHVSLQDGGAIPNLHVMMLMKSLRSRKYVSQVFSWQWSYFTLTDDGTKYLREVLSIPSSVVPLTHKKNKKLQGDRVQKKQQQQQQEYEKGEYTAGATATGEGETPAPPLDSGYDGPEDSVPPSSAADDGVTNVGGMGRGKRLE